MRELKFKTLISIVLTVLLTACARGDLPSYNQLGPLRILSLKVDSPEVSPGTSISVTPYISDLNGSGRTISYRAEACSDPGLNLGYDPSCSGVQDRVDLASGTFDSTNSPGFVSPNFTGPVASIVVNIPSTLLDGKSDSEKLVGVDYIFIYVLTPENGSPITSLKRIRVSSQPQKNSNPVLSSIQSNGSTFSSMPTSSVPISVQFADSARETYTVVRTNGTVSTLTETFITTWFISDGTMDYSRTYDSESNNYSPPASKPTSRSVLIVGVTRDTRGGEEVLKLEL